MRVSERNLLGLMIATIAIIITVGSIFHIKAVAKEMYFSEATDSSESLYKDELKAVLKDAGVGSAGITMTKTSEDGISYLYTVVVNLPGYFDKSNGKEEILKGALENVDINVEGARVCFLFS